MRSIQGRHISIIRVIEIIEYMRITVSRFGKPKVKWAEWDANALIAAFLTLHLILYPDYLSNIGDEQI